MKLGSAVLVVIAGSLNVNAAPVLEINIGGTAISLPVPDSFAAVTKEMEPYFSMSQNFVAPMNIQFAEFLPVPALDEIREGGMPKTDRKILVQTSKASVKANVTKADFRNLSETVKRQNAEFAKEAEARMPGMLKKITSKVNKESGVDLDLSLNQMVPLPSHRETERSLSYSMFLKFNVGDGSDKPTITEGVCTVTFLHLRGKILFFYVYGSNQELEWSRDTAQRWVEEIISANPVEGRAAEIENRPGRSGFDWGRVVQVAIVGGVIGGIASLISKLLRKGRS